MNDATRNELTASAARFLRSYLATGLTGALQAGLDRVRELGVTVTPYAAAGDRHEIERLAKCLETGLAG